MLTAQKSRETLRHVRTIIVDEIHALARDKRGSHLALSLARLDHVCESRPARIGLSATQRPVEEIAAFLVGTEATAAGQCAIVDLGHQRDIELNIEVPPSDLEAVAAREQWADIYDRIAGLVRAHRTTLVFVNTRRLSERVAHNLRERLGEEAVASHHGSLSKERRLRVEQRLKAGELQALVCTASLELGIDIGAIDLVCQIGSPRSVATFLQRVGRSGHALGLKPQGRLFPTSRDELIECAALIRAVRAGRLDRIVQPVAPLDILAQQIVAECACEDWIEDDLYALVRKSWPFRDLSRDDFDEVLEMLAEGVGQGAGRAPPLLHHDRINHVLRGRRGARMSAILNGGAIPEMADYKVVADPDDTTVGTVNEDWAIESMAGDIFLLGSHSWRIKRVGQGEVRVEDAQGAPPTIPFWLGEAPGRTVELSQEVGRLRQDVVDGLGNVEGLQELLAQECGLDGVGALQIIDYLRAARDALGLVPTDKDVVFERFFDETGGMQLVVHAPFGARINRAWGLTLRKRFCVRFDFELQAAASDDSIVLSLGPQHSFPLEESFSYVTSRNAEQSLKQAILYAPVFPVRWRWDAGRALAVPRFTGARKVPPPIQRMRADDLLAAVFPAQVGCQENVTGPLEIPDHPLVRQTVLDCLHEAMDIDGLIGVLQQVEAGAIRLHAIDTLEPSPMAHEILSGKPYTYLDDAPLEERRTRAVTMRRALPENARELGALDQAAIDRVQEEAWPQPRDAEETHDALMSLVAVPAAEVRDWAPWLEELTEAGRAARVAPPHSPLPSVGEREASSEGVLYFAAENLELVRLLWPQGVIEPVLVVPEAALTRVEDRDEARSRLIRGWSEAGGPLSATGLGARLGLRAEDIDRGLRQVESLGFVLRGRFSPAAEEDEFCDRRLLARIHRYTLDRLRREIDPVSQQDFMRFLLRWQHLTPDTKLAGKQGVRQVIARLEGFEAPAGAWERQLLASRLSDYRSSWLDELCLAGEIAWARLTPRKASTTATASASRSTPVSLTLRSDLHTLLAAVRNQQTVAGGPKTGAAAEILELLQARGALFFDEIVNGTRRLRSDVERGLRELVAWGLVTADGFQGLRQLSGKAAHSGRRRSSEPNYAAGGFFTGSGPAGRWALVPSVVLEPDAYDELAESIARVLLQRYGVVFRDLWARESFSLPWRDVLRALRRLEARGMVRGGRFVSGPSGEQYALPEAVDALRRVRRTERNGERVWVSAIDPLNLAGVILPGGRIPAQSGKGVLYIDGLPLMDSPAEPTAVKAPVPSS
jgi:ATP-dependent Lhr-like helicase